MGAKYLLPQAYRIRRRVKRPLIWVQEPAWNAIFNSVKLTFACVHIKRPLKWASASVLNVVIHSIVFVLLVEDVKRPLKGRAPVWNAVERFGLTDSFCR